MFGFPVVKSSFSFADIDVVTVPTAGFVYHLGHLGAAESVLVWKEGFQAACVLEYYLEEYYLEVGIKHVGDGCSEFR